MLVTWRKSPVTSAEPQDRMPGRPRISIIIPVYNVADYLPECLNSVLGQKFGDIEVIAVDGGSDDDGASGDILDARAQADRRIQVVHTDEPGPGQARNTGLGLARGQYVWFVDADDVVPPGSMQALADAAEQDRPDVLLLDFEFLYPDGRTLPNSGRDLLRVAPPGNFQLADWPEAISLTATAWSKAFRREFLVGLKRPFPRGIHEDIPVSFTALLGADTICALPRVCYLYRQRPGSFMASTTEDHFDIFHSWRQILDLAANGEANGLGSITAEVRAALFERAIGHYATNLDGGGGGGKRVPQSGRRRYFSMMSDDFVAYRPSGYRPPRGALGAKYRLIKRNAYRSYSAMRLLNDLRMRVRRTSRHASGQSA